MRNIDIKLKPSRQFICLIGLVVVGSVVISVNLPLPDIGKSVLVFSTLAYGIGLFWFAGLLKGDRSIIGLQLLAEGSCQLYYPTYAIVAKIKGDSTVTNAVCLLRFIIPGERRVSSCIVFKDSLDRERYRQLLVWLRCC